MFSHNSVAVVLDFRLELSEEGVIVVVLVIITISSWVIGFKQSRGEGRDFRVAGMMILRGVVESPSRSCKHTCSWLEMWLGLYGLVSRLYQLRIVIEFLNLSLHLPG